MTIKALRSFIGRISMNVDDVREVADEDLANELIRVGHAVAIEGTKLKAAPEVAEAPKEEVKEAPKEESPKKKKGKK